MPRSVPERAPTVWYFGYGSNMDPRTFLGRRKMRPLSATAGRVDGWRLCFDLPVGRGERAVANVQPVVGAHVWGVAYEIAVPEAARLDRTEGVPRGYYVRRPVTVQPPDAEPITAFTYHSARGRCQWRHSTMAWTRSKPPKVERNVR